MNTPSNEQLVEMAGVFDQFILEFCDEYRLSPLAASGLILARLTKLSKEFEYQSQFEKLMMEIVKINATTQNIVTNNTSTALH